MEWRLAVRGVDTHEESCSRRTVDCRETSREVRCQPELDRHEPLVALRLELREHRGLLCELLGRRERALLRCVRECCGRVVFPQHLPELPCCSHVATHRLEALGAVGDRLDIVRWTRVHKLLLELSCERDVLY